MITHHRCNNSKNLAVLQQLPSKLCVLQSKITINFGDTHAKNYQRTYRTS